MRLLQILQRRLRRPERAVAGALLAAAVLVGCASGPAPQSTPAVSDVTPEVQSSRGPLIAKDQRFAIAIAAEGDDLPSLAKRYLGDADQAWRLAEFNGVERIQRGDAVVIPLRIHNRIGVTATGYQTIPILCYHRFGPKVNRLTVTKAAFEAQMDYLARNGYHVIPIARLRDFLDGKEALPRKSVVITIDDGYRSTYDIAYPVLRKYGFPATVYLYSDFVGASDALTWPQMKEMVGSGLVEVQPHSKTHSNLTQRLADENDARYRDRIRREVDAPINLIRERLDQVSSTYAYPYGDVNETVVSELTRAGLPLGVTVTPGGNGFFAYPYMLRRTMIFGTEDLDAFKAKLVTFTRSAAR